MVINMAWGNARSGAFLVLLLVLSVNMTGQVLEEGSHGWVQAGDATPLHLSAPIGSQGIFGKSGDRWQNSANTGETPMIAQDKPLGSLSETNLPDAPSAAQAKEPGLSTPNTPKDESTTPRHTGTADINYWGMQSAMFGTFV